MLTLPVGIGMAIAGALLPVAVKERFPDRPAFGNGVCTSGFNLGGAVSSLVAVPVADAFGDWRAALTLFSVAAVAQCVVPDAGVLWTAMAGLAIGAVFPLCLTMCLDVADEPGAAGAAAALLGGYLVAGLAPFGLGAVRDLIGSFSASPWALFGTSLLLVVACLPLTATRRRPV